MYDGIIILGAGGHAKVIADIILTRGEKLIGFFDDNTTGTVLGYPILGKICDIDKYKDNCSFIIGIGKNQTRKNIAEKYKISWYTAIHPDTSIARAVEIGEGTVVMARAVVNPSAKIGSHCIINTAAVVEHDNTIGNYVHISPNATLCGTVDIGELTHIGAGSVIRNNVKITENCTIGCGAIVVRDINISGTYVGAPVKLVKQ